MIYICIRQLEVMTTTLINIAMTYTTKQIENAKANYNAMLVIRSVESYEPEFIGMAAAEQRCEFHNNIVTEIKNGNKELEKEWKLFFLGEEIKKDRKAAESKSKLNANKSASQYILDEIKSQGKKLGDYYKWLNTSGNPYRKEYFSKKYTEESATKFINI